MDKTQWNERIKLIEKTLVSELQMENALDDRLCESMQYSLMAGGKRLRPILVMAAADAVGAVGTDFIHIACALEMIHTYSLIHDDLPAMDNDDYRRGKLTNHKVYGDGMAILAGDALLTQAFEVILRQENVDQATLLRVVREIAVGAGPNGMVGGQAIDLESEGKQQAMDLKDLQRMHGAKTGALFKAAIRSGAIVAGASEEELAALTKYADCFGLAFQITDDILDVIGDEKIIGKPVGSDQRNDKSTYVSLTSLESAQKLASDTVAEAIASLEMFGDKAAFLRELVEYLLNRNK
ncbi:polyprenyl synthetase family protein [Anaerovibrio sp.]|uniref:polyprenyl synthetase family protein n=1 Tax=Anaerovibrio sp. TaxID=1872532 RepID=UPI0025EDEE2E|nr:farnesyl diphosphate synthase [Anaerovibrio sp.]